MSFFVLRTVFDAFVILIGPQFQPRFNVTTASSGRLNSRKPLMGTVLFPRPRETNRALSPRRYTPDVRAGRTAGRCR